MSPLVVCVAGNVLVDLVNEPLGKDLEGKGRLLEGDMATLRRSTLLGCLTLILIRGSTAVEHKNEPMKFHVAARYEWDINPLTSRSLLFPNQLRIERRWLTLSTPTSSDI